MLQFETGTSYDQSVEVNANDYNAWYNRGNMLASLGKFEDAIESYDHALNIEPDDFKARYNKALMKEILSLQLLEEIRLASESVENMKSRPNSLASARRPR